MNIFTILAIICSVIYFIYLRNKKKGKSPPGPFALPVIGNILDLGHNPTLGFSKLADKYGDIYQFKLGASRAVVLNDPKLIKECLNNHDFSGRPDWKVFQYYTGAKIGILTSDGRHWEEQRRFTLRHLRDFGFGKNYMEDLVMEEVQELCDWFKKEEGKPISVNNKLGLAVLNSLWMIMTGNRYKQDDPKLSHINSAGINAVLALSRNPFVVFMEWTTRYFPKITGWSYIQELVREMNGFFIETIEDHKKNYVKGQPRDFIDSYLNEIEKTTDPDSSFYKKNGEKALLAVIGDLFGAGSETTSTTLTWAILYLMVHPEIQKKLQKEIDLVIGKNKLPSLSDRTNMPYTEAVLNETLRKSSLVSSGVMHASMKDTTINGYDIPKDTMVIPNQYYVHHNPKIWGDPQNFRPERFIEKDGSFKKNENMIAFSTGKRVCLGENLARDELFLFLTTIFQKFRVEKDPNGPEATIEPKWEPLLQPRVFNCVMKERI